KVHSGGFLAEVRGGREPHREQGRGQARQAHAHHRRVVVSLSIRVRVLYFGQARDAAGTGEELISLPIHASVGALVNESMKEHQRLKGISGSMRVAVNEELAAEDRRLKDGDVVALLPPVAGG